MKKTRAAAATEAVRIEQAAAVRRRSDRRRHAWQSLRRARPAGDRQEAWSRAASSRMPNPSPPSRWPASRPANCTRRDDAGFFEGVLSIRKRQPLRYRARNAGGEWSADRSLFVRPGARARWTTTTSPKARICRLFDKLGAHLIYARGRRSACISRSGRPTPSASRWSATSTTGTAAATRCGIAGHRHLGDLHSRYRRGPALQIRDHRRRMACGCRSRPIPSPSARNCARRPPRSPRRRVRHEWGDEAHRAYWAQGRPPPRSRCRSTRSMPAPGSARRRHVPVMGRDWPTG